jgi:hypothetical protein
MNEAWCPTTFEPRLRRAFAEPFLLWQRPATQASRKSLAWTWKPTVRTLAEPACILALASAARLRAHMSASTSDPVRTGLPSHGSGR